MAAPGKPTGSRWGSFLSQAVAGVESRLDNMLTEGEDGDPLARQATVKPVAKPAANNAPPPAQPAPKPAPATRATPSSRSNDRLQARLAKAMAARNVQAGGSPRSSIDQPSPASSVRASMDKDVRPGTDTPPAKETPDSEPATPDPAGDAASIKSEPTTTPVTDASASAKSEATIIQKEPPREAMLVFSPAPTAAPPLKDDATNGVIVNAEVKAETIPELNIDSQDVDNSQTEPELKSDSKSDPPAQHEELDKKEKDTPTPGPEKQELEKDASKEPGQPPVTNSPPENSQAKEEIQEYVERIDALQAKLQYLSKNALEAAKQDKASASKGSVEQKLAEKDEKIALLMEEGQKLSSNEGKFRTTIRKLRAQLADNEKQVEELKKSKEKAVAEAEVMRNSAQSHEEQERKNEEVRKASAALKKEADALKKEVAAKDEAYRRLEQDAKLKAEQAEYATTEAVAKARGVERTKQKELEDTIAKLRTDNETLTNKARLDGVEWQEKLNRITERSNHVEEELKLELRATESKLEAMRVAAEQASSGAAGESQMKLIRQIETLQSQYASASDNWQGIEASLLAKVSILEKEKDEAQRRESEMRKKARDSASRCRRLEDELQDVTPALATARQELEACKEELATLRTHTKKTETALEQAKAELDKQQRSASFGPDMDRRQWVDDVKSQSRPNSPMLSVPRTFSSDFAGLPVPGRPPRRAPTPGSNPDSAGESLFFGRRLSNQPPGRNSTLSTLGSGMPPPPPLSPFDAPSESPRAMSPPPDRDDDVDSSAPRNVAQDMISVSTVGAGPSVQLVERMSAAIRRLEAEKVAAKEEMVRVCSQRDEARSDMVGLMKDVEANKAATERVKELEVEMDNMNQRYQTTLELLGEKSELVEELKADVEDVKAMYRDLVERTIK
ncbi:TATA element modulatory factor 1 TATA binding-domain-containing protein [Mariannaea sp. PMI_226]|nr:TATA element modulatory factor 1 TATA binding-domain-containing protein [Mariannaea sp. PMI_226]